MGGYRNFFGSPPPRKKKQSSWRSKRSSFDELCKFNSTIASSCVSELTIVDDVFPDDMDNWQNEEKIKYKARIATSPRFLTKVYKLIYREQCNIFTTITHRSDYNIQFHLDSDIHAACAKKPPIYQERWWCVLNKLYEEMEVKLDIYWGSKCPISGICNALPQIQFHLETHLDSDIHAACAKEITRNGCRVSTDDLLLFFVTCQSFEQHWSHGDF